MKGVLGLTDWPRPLGYETREQSWTETANQGSDLVPFTAADFARLRRMPVVTEWTDSAPENDAYDLFAEALQDDHERDLVHRAYRQAIKDEAAARPKPARPEPRVEDEPAPKAAAPARNSAEPGQLSERDRIMARVEPQPGCWKWTGYVNPYSGYAQLSVRRDGAPTTLRGHRAVYETLVGPVPDGLTLDHLCSNKACVNPAHLEPVTHEENIQRAARLRDQTHAAGFDCGWKTCATCREGRAA